MNKPTSDLTSFILPSIHPILSEDLLSATGEGEQFYTEGMFKALVESEGDLGMKVRPLRYKNSRPKSLSRETKLS